MDGVIQAPGRPDEDLSDNFQFGGWTAPYFHKADEEASEYMQKNLHPTDRLLGRKTYEMFADYWPNNAEKWPGINEVKKYVVTESPIELSWINSERISGDVVTKIKALKMGEGSVLKVIGSADFTQTLLDMTWWMSLLMIFLVTRTGLFGRASLLHSNFRKAWPQWGDFRQHLRSGR